MRRVGIDLALRAPHRATIYEGAEQIGKPIRVARSMEGIETLIRRATAGDEDCEFIMEPTGLAWLPLAAELDRRGFRTFVPKPQKTSALRKFLAQFAKTDTIDARAQALIRHVDPSGVHPLHVPTAAETTLRTVAKQRARLVVDAARIKGRIQSWLVLANPDLCAAFGDGEVFTNVGTALLRSYIDPFRIRDLGKAGLHAFCKRHGSVACEQLDAIWAASEGACALYAPLKAEGRLPFDYEATQTMVRLELERLEHLEHQIFELEVIIKAAYAKVDPDRVLEREAPGIGSTIAPTVEGFVGNIERFDNAKQFAAFFGLVPRTSQTGGGDGKPKLRLTKGGQSLLRQYMFLAAEAARRSDPLLAQTYATAIARGKHHYAAVIVVAHKLVRRIYALLKLRAAARQDVAEGRVAREVAWKFATPDGELLTRKQARAWVTTHFPPKAAKKTAAAESQTRSKPQRTGSSEDATNANSSGPPHVELAATDDGAKPLEKPMENHSQNRTLNTLDRS